MTQEERALKRLVKCKKKLTKLIQKHSVVSGIQVETVTEGEVEKLFYEKNIKSKAILSICFGSLVLAINFLLSLVCRLSSWSPFAASLIECISTVLTTITSIIVGIGISTLVLDFFGYIKYTKDRIKEVMVDKEYIKTLSDDEKRMMIGKAEESLYFKNGQVVDTSLYANIKERLIPLIDMSCITQYAVQVDCYPDEKSKTIKKQIHKVIEIICHKENDIFEMPFSTYCFSIPGIDSMLLYNIDLCKFNGCDLTEDAKSKIKMYDVNDEAGNTDVKFVLKYDLKLNKGKNIIEIRTTTIVPISDNTYEHTITMPCKRYNINFSVHNKDYEVLGYAFAWDSFNGVDNLNRVIYKYLYDGSFRISFENWTLPGNGCVFVIKKK